MGIDSRLQENQSVPTLSKFTYAKPVEKPKSSNFYREADLLVLLVCLLFLSFCDF
jgi:hypothetical protein